MQGPLLFVVAAITIPDAKQCFVCAAPVLAFFTLRWILRNTDRFIERLFPHWEWEKRLGWLNLRTQRRAETVLRWIGYFIYALLAAALYGIVWAASALGELGQANDPEVLGEIGLKLPVLLGCLVFWLGYLGCELLPKMRRQYEKDELEKFRAEQSGRESEREAGSRETQPLSKPRGGSSFGGKISPQKYEIKPSSPKRFGPRN